MPDSASSRSGVAREEASPQRAALAKAEERHVVEGGAEAGSAAARRLQVAVIGVGPRGRNLVRLCVEMDRVALVGIADPDPAQCRQVASRYHTQGFSNYRTLLEAQPPDLALLSVPRQWAYPIALDLIEQGIHVLLETPMVVTAEEGQMLVRRARASGAQLGMGLTERFNPAVTALKKRISRGELGRIFQISASHIGGPSPRVQELKGVLNLATCELHVMLYLAGANVLRVSAELGPELEQSQEEMLCGVLRFANGVVGLLNVNGLSPTHSHELVVCGQRGMFVVNYLTQELCFFENSLGDANWIASRGSQGMAEGRMIRYPISSRDPQGAQLDAVVHAILHDKPFPVSGVDGLQAILVAQRLIEAGQQGRSLHLDTGGYEVVRAEVPVEAPSTLVRSSPVL